MMNVRLVELIESIVRVVLIAEELNEKSVSRAAF